MNFNKVCLAFIFGSITLIGCGGGSSETAPAPVAESAVISSLIITTELTEQGQILQALISCTACLPASHQYNWSIEGLPISNTDNYLLTSNDFNKEVRIEVSVSNDANLPDTTYKVIVPSRPQVAEIYSNPAAFAALKTDGSVVTWGDGDYGGNSSAVELTNVAEIYSNNYAFAALKTDGSVVTWR